MKPRFPMDRLRLEDAENLPTAEQQIRKIIAQALKPVDDPELHGKDDAERKLLAFTKQAWHIISPMNPFVDGWHIGCICEHIEALDRLEIRDLVINAPPRHSKSSPIGAMLTPWKWTTTPSVQFIYNAYDEDLVDRDQDFVRRIVRSSWYQSRWGHQFQISPGQNRIDEFWNTRGGYRLTATSTNPPTGRGAEWVCSDDPNGIRQIRLAKVRQQVIDCWDQAFARFFNDPNNFRRLVIQQSVGAQDLSHYLRDKGWQCLTLPAEYEPARYFFPDKSKPEQPKPKHAIERTALQERKPELRDDADGSKRKNAGDILWPERFNAQNLEEERKRMGAGYASQYQQRPGADEGDIFARKDFRYCHIEHWRDPVDQKIKSKIVLGHPEPGKPPPDECPLERCTFFQIIDTALKVSQSAKYTAVLTMFAMNFPSQNGTRGRRFLGVWDSWREKLAVPEQYAIVRAIRRGRGVFNSKSRVWDTACDQKPWPKPIALQMMEPKASGVGILQDAAADGYPLEEIKGCPGDKIERLGPVASLCRNGVVFFNEHMPELDMFETELIEASAITAESGIMDQADCFGYGGIMFNRHKFLQRGAEGMFIYPNAAEIEAIRNANGNRVNIGGQTIELPEDDPFDGWR